jgi:hypothetical protein
VGIGSKAGRDRLGAVTTLGAAGESTNVICRGVAGGSWGTERGAWGDEAERGGGVQVGSGVGDTVGAEGESTLGGSWMGTLGRQWVLDITYLTIHVDAGAMAFTRRKYLLPRLAAETCRRDISARRAKTHNTT